MGCESEQQQDGPQSHCAVEGVEAQPSLGNRSFSLRHPGFASGSQLLQFGNGISNVRSSFHLSITRNDLVWNLKDFRTNSADLLDEHKQLIREIAAVLNEDPSASATILGFADSRGTEQYNFALGQRRADSARLHLASLLQGDGEVERLYTSSVGESECEEGGNSPNSRKVEIRVTRQEMGIGLFDQSASVPILGAPMIVPELELGIRPLDQRGNISSAPEAISDQDESEANLSLGNIIQTRFRSTIGNHILNLDLLSGVRMEFLRELGGPPFLTLGAGIENGQLDLSAAFNGLGWIQIYGGAGFDLSEFRLRLGIRSRRQEGRQILLQEVQSQASQRAAPLQNGPRRNVPDIFNWGAGVAGIVSLSNDVNRVMQVPVFDINASYVLRFENGIRDNRFFVNFTFSSPEGLLNYTP